MQPILASEFGLDLAIGPLRKYNLCRNISKLFLPPDNIQTPSTSNVITIDVFVSNGSYDVTAVVLICEFAKWTMKEHSVENTEK